MKIIKANPEHVNEIADLILLAMEEIVYEFLENKSHEDAKKFMLHAVSLPYSQYSYSNTWVLINDEKVVGAACVYNGNELEDLRKPIANYVENITGKPFLPENETEEGEYYLDSIGINPNYQGQGLGTTLLNFLIEEYRTKTLGLLVEKAKPKTRKLYESLGFKFVKEKTLMGIKLDHLQLS